MHDPRPPSDPPGPSLKSRALKLLAQREHTRQELEKKLKVHETAAEGLPAVLDLLEAKGLISEERVVSSVVHRRGAKLGRGRIVQELQQKGVSALAIAKASADLKATELSRAQAVWQKKFGAPAMTPQEKARQWRFMSSRGFGPDVLRCVLGGQEPD